MNAFVKIKRLDHALPKLERPAYAKPNDSGLDLRARDDVFMSRGARAVILCGFAIALPVGFEGQVRPRSSGSKRGLDVALGTVDADYRGEIGMTVINNTGTDHWVRRGERVAQLVIAPVARAVLEDAERLDDTERGAGGYGSTGDR